MRKVYHLSSCSTCQRILKDLPQRDSFTEIDIKVDNISLEDLTIAAEASGSFESVFSKRAMKYRAQGLHEQDLTEEDYKELILKEYTFLKRPVFFVDDQVFVGNSKKVVAALYDYLK